MLKSHGSCNLVEVIGKHVKHIPQNPAYTFLGQSGEVSAQCSFGQLHQRAMAVAGLLAEYAGKGARAMLLYSPGISFIEAFTGCLYAGVVAVPVAPPTTPDMLSRLRHIVEDASPSVVLCDRVIAPFLQTMKTQYERLKHTPIFNTEEIDDQWLKDYAPADIDRQSLAFLQYTSGSTGYPKGVMVTHGNLLHNETILTQFTHQTQHSVAVSWLPHYHDMGLIGCILFPLFVGFHSVLMAPERFVRYPLCWLKAISDFGATFSTAPNFAYALCLRMAGKAQKIGLELSRWEVAINGAEPVRLDVLERFYKAFKPYGLKKKALCPAYGLAEATLFVSSNRKGRGPSGIHVDRDALSKGRILRRRRDFRDGLTIVDHGTTSDDQRMVVVDPEGRVCPEGAIGEIWLAGPSMAAGYWNRPAQTQTIFNARLANGEGPFLRTGDLGFMDRGALYITGRLKDLIIIQGRNIYPQDVEAVVEAVDPAIRSGRAVAFAVPGDLGEALCIVAEYRGGESHAAEIFGRVNIDLSRALGLKPEAIVLIRPKTLLLTSSGKVRRSDMRKAFVEKRLETVAAFNRSAHWHSTAYGTKNSIIGKLRVQMARRLGLTEEEIDIETPLGQYGLSSMDAVALAAELEAWGLKPFPPTLIYENPTISALARLIQGMSAVISHRPKADPTCNTVTEPIAIIGMACRFPGATDADRFWQMLAKGESHIAGYPAHRFGGAADGEQAGIRGGFVDGMTHFDAAFFNISAAEALWMDPQHRKFLEVAWSAIENAACAPSRLAGTRTGVFVGVCAQEYHREALATAATAQTYAATGLSAAMIANRISYLLDLHGPSETIDTACSSSLVAVHRAVRSLRSGECELAIAGGANGLLSRQTFSVLAKAGFLSEDGVCRPFDAGANGYVRGEGFGAILLKPLAQAKKDGDPIYAVIKGSAVIHGGRTASLTAPSEARQAMLLKAAYAEAGLSPRSVTYIEAHGTGTRLGDPIEVNGLKEAFRHSPEDRGQVSFKAHCALGSVKGNIGHAEAAAGIAGLIKTALAMENKTIPPTTHFKKLNPYIDLKDTPFYIADKKKPWRRLTDADGHPIPRRAGVSSFGFGGTYAHVVLEETGDTLPARGGRSRGHVVLLSGKTPDALLRNIQAFHAFLAETSSTARQRLVHLADIAYTTQTGRDHYQSRAAFIVGSKAELRQLFFLSMERAQASAGELFVSEKARQFASFNGLHVAAASWLGGADFKAGPSKAGRPGRSVPLPAYQFEPSPHWIEVLPQNKVVPSPIIHSDGAIPPPSPEEALQWLADAVAAILGVPATELDLEMTFDELGLDSLALINLHDRVQHHFRQPLPISVIQEYPNIKTLSRRIAGDTAYIGPDLWQELADQKAKLRLPLEGGPGTINAPRQNGLGDHILVTGVTGFLGAFLLYELVVSTSATLYCLVRAADVDTGRRRLDEIAARFQIPGPLPDDRIKVICGELGRERFGLTDKQYEALAWSVDTVFHCGAVVDWMKPYAALKQTNVEGTLETLRFSLQHKVKRMHHISSLAVLPLLDGNYQWLESDQPPPEALTNGYAQSKWVAERLCIEARDLGLPVSIYRFDYVAGRLGTGAMKESDFIVRLIRGCVEIGSIPSDEVNFDIHAVDYLSKAIVAIACSARPQTFHLINRKPFLISDFTRVIRKFGYILEPVPFHRWKQLVRANADCALFSLYPFLNLYDADQLAHYQHSTIDNTNAMKALYEADQSLILGAPPACEVMEKVIAYFQAKQVLPPAKRADLLKRQADYWRRQLVDAPARLPLPVQAYAEEENTTGVVEPFAVDAAVVARMESLALAENVSLSEILLSIFQVLLFRYCRSSDIPVAVAVTAPGGGDGSRCLARVPVIRTQLTPPASLRTLVSQVKQMASEAYAHLDLPSDVIAGICRGKDEDKVGDGYDVLFAFSDGAGGRLNLFPLTLEEIWRKQARLTLWFERSGDVLQGRMQCAAPIFAPAAMTVFVRHFQNLLKALTSDPDTDLFRVPMLSAAERAQMLDQWNNTAGTIPATAAVHDIFTMQARKRPDAVAVSLDGQQMTYATLDRKSDQLAQYLIQRGIGAGDVVGLCMEKSFELVIGFLGILKAGGIYFAMEPSYPHQRLLDMLNDAQARMVLALSDTAGSLATAGAAVVRLDREWAHIEHAGNETVGDARIDRHQRSRRGAVAYMIYTSGSTGRPKGVRVFHSSLVNLLYAMDELLNIEPGEQVLSCSSLSYDASVPELFLPLVKGATLVLIPMAVAKDGFRLKAVLDAQPIAFMNATVATWRMLAYAGWQGSPAIRLINGGEALPYPLAQTLIRWSRAAFNGYGPAETTVCATIKRLVPGQSVTIGKPLANIRVYILDDQLNPMPVGAIGELYIGGRGVAQGYHRQAELTAERFILDPFDTAASRRMYKTGDLAYYLPNGEIVFVGRSDQQVKIRGHRIELGEIEKVLEDNPLVKACTVLAMEDQADRKHIVAYFIPSNGNGALDIPQLRKEVSRVLPPFMVPSDFVAMERFPETPGGKVDRRGFPKPGKTAPPEAFVAPQSAMEIQVADIWKEILDLQEVGIHSNFLELGGDSISAMRLLIGINARFGTELTIQNLYDNLTIARLSKAIAALKTGGRIAVSRPHVDFVAETAFDLHIAAGTAKPVAAVPDGLRNLLVTGVTGFLGAYILHSLLESTDKIAFCLVRAEDREDAVRRIQTNLERFHLWKASYIGRITPVPGDLGLPGLGIEADVYEALSHSIDAIYHCGSVVNFAYPYPLLRKANVDGTKEILKLAANGKIKHLFYISTIGVYEQYSAINGQRIAEHEALPDPRGLFFGYSQSKWVSERIVAAARQKGLPISIFRPSAVLGATTTGASNLDDLVNVMIRVFAAVGAVPDLDFRMNGLPVDFVADAVVRISLSPLARGGNFHIVHPRSVPVRDLIGHLISYGYDLPILSSERWLKVFSGKAATRDDLAPYIPVIEKEISGMNGHSLPTFSFDNTRKILKDYSAAAPVIDEKLFHTYLAYMESVNYIPMVHKKDGENRKNH